MLRADLIAELAKRTTPSELAVSMCLGRGDPRIEAYYGGSPDRFSVGALANRHGAVLRGQ